VKVKATANTVIFYSVDGYTTSLPLNYIMDMNIILAYKINDAVLNLVTGFPFQVAAEGKYGYKWAKWVMHIELSNDSSYKGFWEKSGYSNDATVYK
jgi:DMSO/TMAO reductase YedYZ molybdopterin-dependent catalytic subunit